MKEILSVNLQVRIYRYKSKEKMDKHKEAMIKAGWECRYSGKTNLSPESTVTAFCDDKNWHYVAEYCKQKEQKTNELISYNTEGYFFSVYNSNSLGR